MTTITWVLAADGCRASIFETHGLKLDLQEIEDLTNPAPRATELSEKDREKFARTVANYLDHGRLHNRFDRLRQEPRLSWSCAPPVALVEGAGTRHFPLNPHMRVPFRYG